MQTPAGTECLYYFADFHRGRNIQSCRLIEQTARGGKWTPDLCARCHVPRIVLANACPNLMLEARVHSSFLGMGKRVDVSASCLRTLEPVEVAEIGCGHCHDPFPPFETNTT